MLYSVYIYILVSQQTRKCYTVFFSTYQRFFHCAATLLIPSLTTTSLGCHIYIQGILDGVSYRLGGEFLCVFV